MAGGRSSVYSPHRRPQFLIIAQMTREPCTFTHGRIAHPSSCAPDCCSMLINYVLSHIASCQTRSSYLIVATMHAENRVTHVSDFAAGAAVPHGAMNHRIEDHPRIRPDRQSSSDSILAAGG